MTKKQGRAQDRIRRAKRRKRDNYYRFITKLAIRKTGQHPEPAFCCLPQELGMSIDEFLSHGQKLAGGTFYLFPEGKLDEIMPADWGCTQRKMVHILTREYVEGRFEQDGRQISSNW